MTSNTTFYLETGSTDPAYNLAFEEYVHANRQKGNYLILWQNHNAVIIGRNQNTLQEIDSQFIAANDIRVIRRNTGGGAVYHDMGNLNYSFIADSVDAGHAAGQQFIAPVVQALRGLGLDAEASGRNDILVSGHKVSGTAQHLMKGRLLHHGTLLFDSDPNMIAGALRPDPTKFQSKSVKSVRSRVGNIRAFLPSDMDITAFWDYLKLALAQGGLVPGSLTEEELAEVQKLKAEKYDTWQWNYGSSPKFQICNKKRWPGGLLEVRLSVEGGNIKALRIFGDFLALTPIDDLQNALLGCHYRQDALAQTLKTLPVSQYLGSITRTELLSTLLNEEISSVDN